MRINKVDLAKKLGVTERALSTWQREGMPVLEHGRRGLSNTYDLAAVVRWMRNTGRGMTLSGGRKGPVDLDAIERELDGSGRPPEPDHAAIIARAVALARVDWLRDMPSWDVTVPAGELADLGDLLIVEIATQMKAAGYAGIGDALDAICVDAAWPEGASFDQVAQVAAAHVPRVAEVSHG